MYQTEKISVYELVYRMRNMQVGDEIGLSQTEDGEYSYGIRCLPGSMFDNGMCWIADYYGGGCVTAFSETGQQFMEDTCILLDEVRGWLVEQELVDQDFDSVNVQIKDGSLPETKWEFKATEVRPKNRMVCVNFDLRRPFHTYVSVPYNATDSEIKRIAKKAIGELTCNDFDQYVISSASDLDPFIEDEDFAWMEVDSECNLSNADITDRPTGTLSR